MGRETREFVYVGKCQNETHVYKIIYIPNKTLLSPNSTKACFTHLLFLSDFVSSIHSSLSYKPLLFFPFLSLCQEQMLSCLSHRIHHAKHKYPFNSRPLNSPPQSAVACPSQRCRFYFLTFHQFLISFSVSFHLHFPTAINNSFDISLSESLLKLSKPSDSGGTCL